MTTLTQKKSGLPASYIVLGLLTLLGVGLAIYRLVVGLGPTTNLSDSYPWGLWITLDVFLIPIGGAAFTTSFIGHYFDDRRYHAVVRPAVMLGFLCYTLVAIILIVDLGRWDQFYSYLIPNRMNYHSFLWEVAMAVLLYTLILALEIAPIFLEKWNIQAPLRFLQRAMLIIAGLGVVISSLHQSSIGHLFLMMPNKLHPIWWTPLLGLQYLLQAVFGGLAMAAVVITLTWKRVGHKLDKTLLTKMGKLIRILISIYLAITVIGWLAEGDLGRLFTDGAYSLLIWAELVVAVIVPLAILFTGLGKRSDGVFWASVFVVLGLFLNRLIVSWIGLAVPAWATYVPSWIEIAISVGFFAGAYLVYDLVARNFTLFPEHH